MTDVAPGLLERLQRSRIGPLGREAVSRAVELQWRATGRRPPAPPHRKREIVCGYVRRFRPHTFVETGTYRGDTLAAVAPLVTEAVSIELDVTLADLARRRFAGRPNVRIVTGDSAIELGGIVASLDARAVFWLDGHFSGGPTADAGSVPIFDELRTVLSAGPDHVVLIDDMRLFDGTDGYPTVDQLRAVVTSLRPDWIVDVADDIARVHRPDG